MLVLEGFAVQPVIFMTADRRFRPAGGGRVLEKPFGVADLLDALRVAVELS